MEQAHTGEACLADLRGAHEVEIADARRLPRRALVPLDQPQPSRAAGEQVADIALRVAKMAPRIGVRQKARDPEMRIGSGQPLDQRP